MLFVLIPGVLHSPHFRRKSLSERNSSCLCWILDLDLMHLKVADLPIFSQSFFLDVASFSKGWIGSIYGREPILSFGWSPDIDHKMPQNTACRLHIPCHLFSKNRSSLNRKWSSCWTCSRQLCVQKVWINLTLSCEDSRWNCGSNRCLCPCSTSWQREFLSAESLRDSVLFFRPRSSGRWTQGFLFVTASPDPPRREYFRGEFCLGAFQKLHFLRSLSPLWK